MGPLHTQFWKQQEHALSGPHQNSLPLLPGLTVPRDVAVRMVDVTVEFKPQIKAAAIEDSDKNVVVVFACTSGHGKSTEINAFISYLLRQRRWRPGTHPSDRRPRSQLGWFSDTDCHLLPHPTPVTSLRG
jgi:hypothetical protein